MRSHRLIAQGSPTPEGKSVKSTLVEVAALDSAEREAQSAVATADEDSSSNACGVMKLTFFRNTKGAPVADLYMGERQLIATTHPATIVGAMFAMKRTRLTVVTTAGSHTGTLRFLDPDEKGIPLIVLKVFLENRPDLLQFLHLAPDESYVPLLQGLEIFALEKWREPNDECDEYIRAAYHHLPKDVIERPLLKPVPKGWKKTLKRRNGWIYFPDC